MEKPNLILYGRVIALSAVEEIASKEAGKPAIKKQQLYLDCTRYDSITGERYENENKPLLELGGKTIEKVGALALQKDDVVMVRFLIQGNPYKDEKTGKSRVFTGIRVLDVEVVRKAGQPAAAPRPAQPAPQPEAKPEPPAPQTQAEIKQAQEKEPLPF